MIYEQKQETKTMQRKQQQQQQQKHSTNLHNILVSYVQLYCAIQANFLSPSS